MGEIWLSLLLALAIAAAQFGLIWAEIVWARGEWEERENDG